MQSADHELLFPPRLIPALRELRGQQWQELVDRALVEPDAGIDRLAFVLLMARLGGCVACHADTYKSLKGCSYCSEHAVRRFRGSDQDLARMFSAAWRDVDQYLKQDERKNT